MVVTRTTTTTRVPVYLHADPILREGLAAQLRPYPQVLILNDTSQAQVGVVACDNIDKHALHALRTLRANDLRLVLVTSHVNDGGLLNAVHAGIVGLLRRDEITTERLLAAITTAANGDGSLPPDLLPRLFEQVKTMQQTIQAHGWVGALSERETEVLRLAAEGLDTREISAKLGWSERTTKNSFTSIFDRLHVRNRTHAVAYALRNGLI